MNLSSTRITFDRLYITAPFARKYSLRYNTRWRLKHYGELTQYWKLVALDVNKEVVIVVTLIIIVIIMIVELLVLVIIIMYGRNFSGSGV